MSDLKKMFGLWKERRRSKGPGSQIASPIISDDLHGANDSPNHLQHGAEGNAFQLNKNPSEVDEESVDNQHGAEGNAFQLNNHTKKEDE